MLHYHEAGTASARRGGKAKAEQAASSFRAEEKGEQRGRLTSGPRMAARRGEGAVACAGSGWTGPAGQALRAREKRAEGDVGLAGLAGLLVAGLGGLVSWVRAC